MGANNSTRRVSFESDENENITVVKGIRLSENVINRMREPAAPPKHTTPPPPASKPAPDSVPVPILPPPLLHPIPPPFDPITSMPPPPALPALIAEPPPPPLPEEPVKSAATILTPPGPINETTPSPPPQAEQTAAPVAPAPEPEVVPEPIGVSTPPPPPPVDEEALRKKITQELSEGLEKDRVKAEQELQGWLESEKARASAHAQATAQSQVKDEVSRVLSVERASAQDNLQQAIIRERIASEDEKRRAQLYEMRCKAKQLEAIEADLQRRDSFYRDQVARLEERSAQFYKVTTENYHKAADEVNAKYKRYEVYPVCADLQGQILACYRENAGKTLHCSNIAALYLQCVNNAKMDEKSKHIPFWTDHKTS